MTDEEKIAVLADIMECEVEDLEPGKLLSDVPEWDSLSALSYIVYVTNNCGKNLSNADVKSFKTVQDIMDTLS